MTLTWVLQYFSLTLRKRLQDKESDPTLRGSVNRFLNYKTTDFGDTLFIFTYLYCEIIFQYLIELN